MQGHLEEDIDANVSVDVLTYLYLDFHLLFHNKAKRKQPGKSASVDVI